MRKTVVALCLLFAAESAQAIPNSWLPRRASACADGAVSARCKCGTAVVRGGYCCGGVAQSTGCTLIEDDANTVFHLYFDGTQARDTKGAAITQVGTVTQVAASGAIPAGAGPFTVSDYYTVPAPVGQTLTVCAVVAAAQGVAGMIGRDNGSSRWVLEATSANTARWMGVATVSTIPTSVSVVCGGQTASTGIIKINLAASASGTTSLGATPGTLFLGRNSLPSSPWTGTIYEVWITTTAPSDALFTSVANTVKAKLGSTW